MTDKMVRVIKTGKIGKVLGDCKDKVLVEYRDWSREWCYACDVCVVSDTVEMTGAELVHYMYEDMYGSLGVLDILEQIIEIKKKGGDWVHQFEAQFESEDFEALCAELRSDISRYEHNIAEFVKRLADMEVE